MDTPVAPSAGEPYRADMATRVAVLEEIACHHKAVMERMDRRFEALMAEHWADFRWLLGVMPGRFSALPGAMAHGFHWL